MAGQGKGEVMRRRVEKHLAGSDHAPERAAQIFTIALALALSDFVLAKSLGWDSRPWHVVLSAAVVVASIIGMLSLVSNSLKETSR
jgi:hypothetical protein